MNTFTICDAQVIGYSKIKPIACEFSTTRNGTVMAKFRVVEKKTNAQPNYWMCICYNEEMAKAISSHLRIGDSLSVFGELNSYGEDKEKKSLYLKVMNYHVEVEEKRQERGKEDDSINAMLVNGIELE